MQIIETSVLSITPSVGVEGTTLPNPTRSLQPAKCSESPTNATLADLKQAFFRQSAQIRAYRAQRDQELAEAASE